VSLYSTISLYICQLLLEIIFYPTPILSWIFVTHFLSPKKNPGVFLVQGSMFCYLNLHQQEPGLHSCSQHRSVSLNVLLFIILFSRYLV